MATDASYYPTMRKMSHADTGVLATFPAGNPLISTQAISLNETQIVTINGAPTGGTFTLTFGANTTTALAFNATAATVQAALVALASIGAGNAIVSGSAGGPYTVYFMSTLAAAPQALLTASGALLTGGTSPSVAVTESVTGLVGVTTSFYDRVLITANLTLTGTTPSYTFKMQTSDDLGTTWYDLPAAGYVGGSAPAAITATGKLIFGYTDPMGVLVRLFATVTGTTPTLVGNINFSAK